MRRAVIAAILSALVLPGLGQIYNRRLRRGAALVVLMSLLLVSAVLALGLVLNRALEAMGEEIPKTGKWAALASHIHLGDLTFLLVILGLMAAVWVFGVIDAYRIGLSFEDRQPAGEPDESDPA